MITLLIIIIAVMGTYLLAAIVHIKAIQKELVEINKEQHTQNMEIIETMKRLKTHEDMLLQHIEILQYLCDQDPMLSRTRVPYTGPIGEA